METVPAPGRDRPIDQSRAFPLSRHQCAWRSATRAAESIRDRDERAVLSALPLWVTRRGACARLWWIRALRAARIAPDITTLEECRADGVDVEKDSWLRHMEPTQAGKPR